jgi:hypothetical protein
MRCMTCDSYKIRANVICTHIIQVATPSSSPMQPDNQLPPSPCPGCNPPCSARSGAHVVHGCNTNHERMQKNVTGCPHHERMPVSPKLCTKCMLHTKYCSWCHNLVQNAVAAINFNQGCCEAQISQTLQHVTPTQYLVPVLDHCMGVAFQPEQKLRLQRAHSSILFAALQTTTLPSMYVCMHPAPARTTTCCQSAIASR